MNNNLHTQKSDSGYLNEVDGLRAVAVLVILAFHLDIKGFTGGFVGVDIFFVISGFLITRLILNEIDVTGSFRFGRFYLRRVRRLFPALFTTQLLTLAAGIILLAPWHLERLGGAVIHALLSISNIFFWNESGYFETDDAVRPLLHTWSLGVEGQFYLMWPILVVISATLLPKRTLPALLVIIGALSLYANIVFADGSVNLLEKIAPAVATWFADGAATIFYLAPFRVFEFAIGAIMVWLVNRRPSSKGWPELALVAGFAAIAYSVVTFNSTTPFPHINGLFPCVGAALAIWGGQARFLGTILRNPLSVGIGKISYSLYLVHWPLIIYWKYYSLETPGILGKIAIAASSIVLAIVMYRYVEQPLRYPSPKSKQSPAREIYFAITCALLVLVTLIPAANIWANNGWTWRLPRNMQLDETAIRAELQDYWLEGIGRQSQFTGEGISVVVIGDSFALDVAYMLDLHPDAEVLYEGTTGSLCDAFTLPKLDGREKPDRDCSQNINRFTRKYPNADLIVLADGGSTWDPSPPALVSELRNNIDLLRANGFEGPIVIYGERPTYEESVSLMAYRFGRIHQFESVSMKKIQRTIPEMIARVTTTSQFYDREGIHYYSPVPVLCGDNICDVLTPDNQLIYFDNYHFTPEGDAYLAEDFVNFLKPITQTP